MHLDCKTRLVVRPPDFTRRIDVFTPLVECGSVGHKREPEGKGRQTRRQLGAPSPSRPHSVVAKDKHCHSEKRQNTRRERVRPAMKARAASLLFKLAEDEVEGIKRALSLPGPFLSSPSNSLLLHCPPLPLIRQGTDENLTLRSCKLDLTSIRIHTLSTTRTTPFSKVI